MLTVSQFKTKVTPKLQGTSLAKISAFYEKMEEAAGNFLSHVRPYSLQRSALIQNAIYDRITSYATQEDVEADGVVDIRPVADRSTLDRLTGTFSKEFDIKKATDTFLIEYLNGVKTLKLSKVLTPRTVLARLDSLTLEGTITAGGDASNLAINTLDYISGSGSLQFDLSGVTGQATITVALTNAIDLSSLLSLGALFEWLKFPDVSRLNSVKLEWGSSSSVYWHSTETAAHDRTFAAAGDNGWMLLRHDWVDASSSGSPDSSDAAAITHLKITLDYDTGAALSNVKIDNFTAALGEAWEVVYYSQYLFTDSTGTTWKSLPTVDTDLIRLDGTSEQNAFLYEFMLTLGQELKGKNAAADRTFFKNQLGNGEDDGKLYDRLMRKYPDQAIIRSTTYHNFDDLSGE